jgi:hypothetical protein
VGRLQGCVGKRFHGGRNGLKGLQTRRGRRERGGSGRCGSIFLVSIGDSVNWNSEVKKRNLGAYMEPIRVEENMMSIMVLGQAITSRLCRGRRNTGKTQ